MIRSPLKLLLAVMAATWIFFFDYLPPVRWIHVPYDIEGYHYPLADYAFQSLKNGRWPLWDPSIYSGMAFTANPQVAIFYPGTWLMFLATWGRERLSYQSLLDLTLVHVALAFTLCFWWLRGKKMVPMAALLGAAVYTYSGYLMTQLQHFGLMVVYAWMPLGFIGIDEAAERNSWKPLWKTAAASALTFLGGYPPMWIVFAVAAGGYALFSKGTWKTFFLTAAAFVFGLVLCAIQVLPSWDASQLRDHQPSYGLGIQDPTFFISYFIANFYDFGLDRPIMTNYGREYLYLGPAGLLGIVMALSYWKKSWRLLVPAMGMFGLSFLFLNNPFMIVWDSIKWSPLLADVIRSGYHLAGLAAAFALLAAIGLDEFLKREGRSHSKLWGTSIGVMGAFILYELVRWASTDPKGTHFVAGWGGLWDLAPALAVFGLGLVAFRASTGRARFWAGAVLILTVAVDYKVLGTGKRFNGSVGQGIIYSRDNFGAMDRGAYLAMKPQGRTQAPDYRVLMLDFGPQPQVSRHIGWSTPTGADPFVSSPYRKLVARYGAWENDRTLLLDPTRSGVMPLFGAKYVTTAEAGPHFKALSESPKFKMVGSNIFYYKVFEYLDPQPIYQFPGGTVTVEKRIPEHRELKVDSPQGGVLTFSENWAPGWSARVDGKPVQIERWEDAFQSVKLSAGQHTVEFDYREPLLPAGAAVSAIGLVLLAFWARAARRESKISGSPESPANKASHAVSG